MRLVRAWRARVLGLFTNKNARDEQLNQEIDAHVSLHMDDNLHAGMTAEEARRQARLTLGSIESMKEEWRERSTIPVIEYLVRDLRFSLRRLRKSPTYAVTAVAVLALGMCSTVAVFALVDAALIKPLPYVEPSRLLAVTETASQIPWANLSYLDYVDWTRSNSVFDSLDAYGNEGFLVRGATGAEPARAARVSSGFFRTLGVTPLMGRSFLPQEETKNGSKVVMLSFGSWNSRFGRRANIVGEPVVLSGQVYTIVGVLPREFHFGPLGASEFWVPIDPGSQCAIRRSCHNLYGVGRLKPGISIEAARANLTAIARRLEEQYPDSNRGQGVAVKLLAEAITGEVRPILTMLLGGAGLLLAIACVNAASLVLVRSEARRREFAVRTALGASMARLASHFVSEGLLIVVAASGLAVVAARWAMHGLLVLIPADMLSGLPFLLDAGLNIRVFACAAGIAVLALGVFSVMPALHLVMSKMREGLTEGSRGSAGRVWRRLGARLVVVELAMSMVLLVAASLFGKSLFRLLRVDLGFRPDHLATLSVAAPDVAYSNPAQMRSLGRDIVAKLETIPGVSSAALTSVLPVSFNGNTDWIRFVGKPYDGNHIEVNERDVSANFFGTIGGKLVRGRFFREDEDETKGKVVIVNETLAKRYFPNEDPIGKQIGDTELSPKSIHTIVGVVADVRDGSLDSEIWPTEYHAFNQDPSTFFRVVARTSVKPDAALAAMTAAIHEVRSDLGTGDEATMTGRMNNSMAAYLRRSSTWLVGAFAAMALLLGIVGLYGVIAYSVSQRTREIGVRIALGAERGAVCAMVLREAGRLVVAGVVLGLGAALVATRFARGLLFHVSTWDVPTLVSAAVVLSAAAAVASVMPARRAAGVNAMEALRAE